MPEVEVMSVAMLARKSESAGRSKASAPTITSGNGLRIAEPGSVFEQEADRVADEIMSGGALLRRHWSLSTMSIRTPPVQRKCACSGSGKCDVCEEEQKNKPVQRKAAGPKSGRSVAAGEAPPIVDEVLRTAGQPLDRDERKFFEARLGRDLGAIRIHSDIRAAESARAVEALAYTVGNHVVFGSGRYAPRNAESRKLLAHELAHTLQQSVTPVAFAANRAAGGEAGDSLEHEADRASDDVEKNIPGSISPKSAATSWPPLQRAKVGWSGGGPLNSKATTPTGTKIERIPLDQLTQGFQDPGLPGTAKGRAIVLLPSGFDATKSADVLIFFHGHNTGFNETSPGHARDVNMYEIEPQLDGVSKPQLIGILPQGDPNSSFGAAPSGSASPSCDPKNKKAFNSDAFITEILDALKTYKGWQAAPTVNSVGISGHSGAGELINENLLGGAASSSLPQTVGTLREVALFDSINGPCEFINLLDWLEKTLRKELADLKGKKEAEQRAYLKDSMHFRSYFERSKPIGNFYSQWNIGPLPSDPQLQAKLSGRKPLKEFLDDWFATNATGLPATVLGDWVSNYAVIDMGSVAHDDNPVNIMTGPTPGGSKPIAEAANVLPKREDGAEGPAAPGALELVHQVLRSPSQPLEESERRWAQSHFGHDFGAVRVHSGDQASESARALESIAYTVGRHIVFNSGRRGKSAAADRRVLGHELAHVLQQGDRESIPNSAGELRIGSPHDLAERRADYHAETPGPVAAADAAALGVLRRLPPEGQLAKDVCETTKNQPKEQVGECNYARPEHCPTYESWIETFAQLTSFRARATPAGELNQHTFSVLGGGAATRYQNKGDKDKAAKDAAPDPNAPAPPATELKPGETFIDHPTDAWVKSCLPDNLRATAYQLPADCADIAIILRHVWLAAHHRTQVIQVGKATWTIGSATGGAAQGEALRAISDIGSQTVTALVAPYSDPQGDPLVSFEQLEPLLHPGDILVWEHHSKGLDKERTGGHTLTITKVDRSDDGRIKSMSFLQGNEPIFGTPCPVGDPDPYGFCADADDKGKILQQLKMKDTKEARKTLSEAPGRRIETASTSGPAANGLSFDHPDVELPPAKKGAAARKVWVWNDDTILLAAGPARAARRPAMATPAKGAKAETHLSDWIKSLTAAGSYPDWQAVLEGLLGEARAFVEGGREIIESEARAVGEAAGKKLRALSKRSAGSGADSADARAAEADKAIDAVGDSRNPLLPTSRDLSSAQDQITTKLLRVLSWIRDALHLALGGSP
jgi:hypothetical protein